jgi:hypothetical protein
VAFFQVGGIFQTCVWFDTYPVFKDFPTNEGEVKAEAADKSATNDARTFIFFVVEVVLKMIPLQCKM